MYRIMLASLLMLGMGFQTGHADEKKKTGTLSVNPNYKTIYWPETEADKAFNQEQRKLADRPVLVSITVNGKLFAQRELQVQSSNTVYDFDGVPPGTCDIKFEGEGMQTVIKRGLQILPDTTNRVIADLRIGRGVKVIEYGTTIEPESAKPVEQEAPAARPAVQNKVG